MCVGRGTLCVCGGRGGVEVNVCLGRRVGIVFGMCGIGWPVGEGCWVYFVCRHVNVCVCGRAPVCLRLCVFGVLDNKTVAACLDVVLTRLGL